MKSKTNTNKNLELFKNEFVIYEDELDGFILTEMKDDLMDNMSVYTVYNQDGEYIGEFSDLTLTDAERQDVPNSNIYQTFLDLIDGIADYGNYNDTKSYPALGYYDNFFKKKEKTPEEIEQEKQLVEELCKSDTIVFHQKDATTVMLNPIYEGKGWDVYQGASWDDTLSTESIHELIKRHDKIVCLGHGTPNGLLSGIISREEVPLLKDKKIFSMWCYAASFWKNNGFKGHGILTSDNFPSEVWECRAACGAEVSKEWIFDNMMLAGEIAGKAIDMCWDNPQGACDLFRKEYSEQSVIETEDEKKVVEFNTNSMQVV